MTSSRISGVLFAAALLLIAQISVAAYITDKLLAGFYGSPDLTAEPIRALPNGTPMEVLEELGKLSRIRLGDNSEGWVETRFVTQEKPAKTMLLELQAKYATLKRQAERQQIETPANPTREMELKEQPVQVKAALPQQQNRPSQGKEPEEERTIEQQLRQENELLRERIQLIGKRVSGEAETGTHRRTDSFQLWLLPLIMLGLLLSFIGGIAFKNHRIARRARQAGTTV
jgi:SH3 domain protein